MSLNANIDTYMQFLNKVASEPCNHGFGAFCPHLDAKEQLRRLGNPTFLQALAEFTHAAVALTAAWEREDREDHTGDFFAEAYPFEKSFDEVVNDIITWLDKQREVKP